MAFDPAEEDPDDEKELDAPGPEVPDEALAWMYKFCSTFGSCWYCGRASRTTWYWLSCVYIVLIWRWPKASYRVLSMVAGAIPRREAVIRSLISDTASPPVCWSVATSSSCGRFFSFATK